MNMPSRFSPVGSAKGRCQVMVHIIASFAFSLIALGASLAIFQTLAEGRTKILRAWA